MIPQCNNEKKAETKHSNGGKQWQDRAKKEVYAIRNLKGAA